MPHAILVVGSVALDDIRTPFGAVQGAFGGSATFFALAARYFAPVRMVPIVGDDLDRGHLEMLRQRGIDTSGVEVVRGRTFRWGGAYGFDRNVRETLFTRLNVFEGFHPHVPAAFRDSPFVFLGNIHPQLQAEVLQQVTKPRFVALDTMNLWIESARLALLDVLRAPPAMSDRKCSPFSTSASFPWLMPSPSPRASRSAARIRSATRR